MLKKGCGGGGKGRGAGVAADEADYRYIRAAVADEAIRYIRGWSQKSVDGCANVKPFKNGDKDKPNNDRRAAAGPQPRPFPAVPQPRRSNDIGSFRDGAMKSRLLEFEYMLRSRWRGVHAAKSMESGRRSTFCEVDGKSSGSCLASRAQQGEAISWPTPSTWCMPTAPNISTS